MSPPAADWHRAAITLRPEAVTGGAAVSQDERVDATRTGAAPPRAGRLLAVSDLHVRHEQVRDVVRALRPGSPGDWLLVAGDVGESVADITWALSLLRDRFARVVWVPGNHELWTAPGDPEDLRGELKYRHPVGRCRELGVDTPENPYPVWRGEGGPAVVVPLFLLYDYGFLPPGAFSRAHAMRLADEAGVICTDEFLPDPNPYPSREAWCRARLAATRTRLRDLPAGLPTVLVNHFPLVRDPTRALRRPEFALWCGTTATADWPVRYRAAAVVHGHLHIPRTLRRDGVPHHEVSLGYPREWQRFPRPPAVAGPRAGRLPGRARRAAPARPYGHAVLKATARVPRTPGPGAMTQQTPPPYRAPHATRHDPTTTPPPPENATPESHRRHPRTSTGEHHRTRPAPTAPATPPGTAPRPSGHRTAAPPPGTGADSGVPPPRGNPGPLGLPAARRSGVRRPPARRPGVVHPLADTTPARPPRPAHTAPSAAPRTAARNPRGHRPPGHALVPTPPAAPGPATGAPAPAGRARPRAGARTAARPSAP